MQQMMTTHSPETMSSLELLDMINGARAEQGEKPITRLNDFHARVADELDGEYYETFVKPPGNGGGRPTTAFRLTRDQCLLVAMRESKAVRRVVRDKLKAVEAGLPPTNVAATMALVECAANLLRASDSGRVVMLRKAGQAVGADISFLPDYTEDSAPGHVGAMDTASITQLLKDHGVKTSSASFNKRLEMAGFLERRTRKTSKGAIKPFWCITLAGQEYGKNVVSPESPRETQPHWYRARFTALLSRMEQGDLL